MRNAAFTLFYVLWTLGLSVAALPLLLLPQEATWRGSRLWAGGILWALRVIVGLRCELRGEEHLPPGACVIACKHQSALEIILLSHRLQRPCFVLKRSLIFIPLFGLYLLKLRMIAVNRARGASALRAMRRAAETVVQQGRPLVIFPEGTRSHPGDAPALRGGLAALHQGLGVPLLPAGVNTGVFWRRNAWRRLPGLAVVELLPPVSPALSSRALLEEVHARINENSAKLLAEARAQE